jgi:glycosyltransferase involved in cell wall biosynthesis
MSRIVFLTRYHFLRYTGGAEMQCWMLAKEFARRGWDVHYISENSRPDAAEKLDGITLHNLPEESPWHDSNRDAVKKLLNELNPDVVYNRVFSLYTAHAMDFSPKHAVTIWASAAAHDGQITTTLPELWQTKTLRQVVALIPRVIYIRSKARSGALRAKIQLAQSQQQVTNLRSRGFSPVLLRNSLENTTAAPHDHDGPCSVLWVGSIKKWKRPELFWELARRCQDLNCEFVMVGELQDELSKEPLAHAERELRSFRYAGFVLPESIGEFYDQAHVLVSTSRAEGFPNTFTQAWLRGVPVLSLDVDPDKLLSDGGLGAHVTDLDGLEQKLRDFLADPELRKEVGRRAQEFAKKEFDLQANVDRMIELIREKNPKLFE